MLRSFSNAVAGMESNQTYLDAVANNVANLNTQGYKASDPVFADLLYQTMRQGSAGTATQGSTNPLQIGLGSQVAGMANNFSEGNLAATGRPDDVAIQGDGFFVVQSGGQRYYTRDGSLGFDSQG